MTGEITSTYSNYLCFTVSIRINQLISQRKYTSHQQENYDLITSLQDEGMGYRRISHYLNERGIKTSRGKKWTNSLVFSVLKRFRQRQERLKDVVGKEYEPVWGKFEVKWMRNRNLDFHRIDILLKIVISVGIGIWIGMEYPDEIHQILTYLRSW